VFTSATPASSPGSARAFSARTMRPPWASGTKISKTERSKQTEVEASTPSSSSAEKISPAHATNEAAFRWLTPTAFGSPVLPEVKIR
jgi:hypothetical protein